MSGKKRFDLMAQLEKAQKKKDMIMGKGNLERAGGEEEGAQKGSQHKKDSSETIVSSGGGR